MQKDFIPFSERLTQDDKVFLLRLARKSVIAATQNEALPEISEVTDILNEKAGAFVTLYEENGDLRGCIGYIESETPLAKTVSEVAKATATRDTRFSPVDYSEVENLVVEINILSPLQDIKAEDVVVGVHGLIIEYGYHRGLLLPQVPVKYGWDREEFLSRTCVKAGLSMNTWREKDVRIQAFTSTEFSEKDLNI